MTDNIFKLTIDNIGEYEIKFLPNIHTPSSPVIGLQTQFSNHHWVYVFFSYALINGEPKIFVFGKKLHPRQEITKEKQLYDLYNFVTGGYFNFKTIKNGNYFDYVDLSIKIDDKYIYPIETEDDQKNVISLYDTFGGVTLDDVRKQYSFKYAEYNSGIENRKLKVIYKHDNKKFDQEYNVYLRNKKMLNIKNRINKQIENEYI